MADRTRGHVGATAVHLPSGTFYGQVNGHNAERKHGQVRVFYGITLKTRVDIGSADRY